MHSLAKVGGLIITLAALFFLADGPIRAVDETPPHRPPEMFIGQIAAVNVQARLLKASNATASLSFQIAPDAKITGKDHQLVPLGDLKTGEKVTVNYTRDAASLVAHQITLTERPSRPPTIEILQ